MPGITVTQACKSYETSHYTVKAVNHADLSVESGEAVAIVGPSGSGKSTLLNIISVPAAFTALHTGEIEFLISFEYRQFPFHIHLHEFLFVVLFLIHLQNFCDRAKADSTFIREWNLSDRALEKDASAYLKTK